MRYKIILASMVLTLLSFSVYSQVDFTSIERGRQQAARDAHEREMRELQIGQMHKDNAPTHDQIADSYLEPLLSYREEALTRGVNRDQFWKDARASILKDRNFQIMPVDLKKIILRKFSELYEMTDGADKKRR